MGRIIKRKTKVSDEIPAASMSDIAFLLLIFFIATTIFDIEQGIPLLLPGVGGKVKKVNPKNVMRITTDPSGQVYVDGNPVRIEDIEGMTRQRLAQNPKTIIAIESHPDSRYETTIQVLDEVKKAEAPVISLRMRRT